MSRSRPVLALALGVLAACKPEPSAEASGRVAAAAAPKITATLVQVGARTSPTEPVHLAVTFEIQDGWHIYWENPGDSGLKTRVELAAPAGWTVGPLQYPGPERYELAGDIVNYGYSGATALFLDLTPAPGATRADLTAQVKWLACHEACVPQSATLTLSVPPTGSATPAAEAQVAPHRARLPAPWAGAGLSASWVGAGPTPELRLSTPRGQASFFPAAAMGAGFLGARSDGGATLVRWAGAAPPTGVVRVADGAAVRFVSLTTDALPPLPAAGSNP